MIEEQFVSFGTARMLKEAGFDVPCRGIYRAYRIGTSVFHEYDRKSTKDGLCRNAVDGFQYEYLAPTQALAARWLREEHHIFIMLTPVIEGYEVAFETALREAIKLIKK